MGNFSGLKENSGRWWIQRPNEPNKNQENHIYHRNLSSVTRFLLSAKKVLHWSTVYAFLFPALPHNILRSNWKISEHLRMQTCHANILLAWLCLQILVVTIIFSLCFKSRWTFLEMASNNFERANQGTNSLGLFCCIFWNCFYHFPFGVQNFRHIVALQTCQPNILGATFKILRSMILGALWF